MPRTPILARFAFYERLRDGTFRDLDWNVVNTSLGAMVEPRQIIMFDHHTMTDKDRFDGDNFTDRRELSDDQFYSFHGTGGNQLSILTNGQS